MKLDEFAFVNQQLAAMLRNGIPLEGALRQLSTTMAHGELRAELEHLEADLAKGVPLVEAMAARKLPPLYTQMIQIGVRSNNLPGMLTMLADYYQRAHTIWTRLKGLMVYPLIVLCSTTALSVMISLMQYQLKDKIWRELLEGRPEPSSATVMLWLSPVLLVVLCVMVILALVLPGTRRWLQWHLPAFREANLARTAWAMRLLLEGGCTLSEAVGLLQRLETDSASGKDFALWQTRLAAGTSRFQDVAQGSNIFPPLFIWMVGNAGEDMVSGFKWAAEVYQARAVFRVEMMLYAALPVSILLLGGLVLMQAIGWILPLLKVMTELSGVTS